MKNNSYFVKRLQIVNMGICFDFEMIVDRSINNMIIKFYDLNLEQSKIEF